MRGSTSRRRPTQYTAPKRHSPLVIHSAPTRGRVSRTFVGRRPFLAGEDGPWVRRKRIQLRELNLRALDCTVECSAANGELAEAIQAAEDALAIEPFRETTYQRLMRVHDRAGNRGEALRTYQRCRAVLAEELGVPPSRETDAVYASIVQA
jgi:SARP family transcriptional regulator, regulator of embCAB operon